MAIRTPRGSDACRTAVNGTLDRKESSVTAPNLLTVEQAAERLGTGPRFIRRLIAERRIDYHKLGRHVRISEDTLAAFIKAGRVASVTPPRRRVA
jgi:excisionase family DNA binding protein